MKRRLIIVLLFVFTCSLVVAKECVKIACVGSRITFGIGALNPARNAYPSQLQTYLGDAYHVENFGDSGSTMLNKGNSAYINTVAYKESLEFNPDIVIIKLGTHYSKDWDASNADEYISNYQDLIDSYQALESNPRIVLITPLRRYLQGKEATSDNSFKMLITPVIKQLAYDNDIEIFDGYSLFGDSFSELLMTDGLHPSSIGAGIIAEALYRYLTIDKDYEFDIFDKLGEGKEFDFHGFKGREYRFDGIDFKVVKPKIANKKHSWVIRARFWDYEPQLDRKLLELGFHITYCDVSNLFGSERAVKRWDKLYDIMISVGLNEKVVLEGISRGGLIVYNWTVKNRKKVSVIYADAPVLDVKSWPIGEKNGEYQQGNIDALLAAYEMSSLEQIMKFKGNPIDNAEKIAKFNIPIIHVVGDADIVVPLKDNTSLFVEKVESVGGKIKVITKGGVGHQPSSLSAPKPILDFILKAEGLDENMCIKPLRGNECRSAAAGWRGNAEWNQVSEDITNTLKKKNVDILMLGNSITQNLSLHRELTGYNMHLKQDIEKIFKGLTWESAGISGDQTQHLLWRIKHGDYNAAKPKYVTINIGVNNMIMSDASAESIYEGIIAVTNMAIEKFPDSKILLFGMLPTEFTKSRLRDSHKIIEMLEETPFDEGLIFVNPLPEFTNNEGNLKRELYASDFIHLSHDGYLEWARLMINAINNIN